MRATLSPETQAGATETDDLWGREGLVVREGNKYFTSRLHKAAQAFSILYMGVFGHLSQWIPRTCLAAWPGVF